MTGDSTSPAAPSEWDLETVPVPESHLAHSAVARLSVPPALALDFLAMFSRFEYALKVTKFRQPQNGEAKADWKTFAEAVSQTFNPNSSPRIDAAFRYLINHPPNYLRNREKTISWTAMEPTGTSEADTILWIIRQVRNNLFHGGKFAQDWNASPARDTRLICTSIILMEELISLDRQVEDAYRA